MISPQSCLVRLVRGVWSGCFRWVLRRSPILLSLALILWLTLGGFQPAIALTVPDIPNPRAKGGWISDTADQISAPMERRLNGLLNFLEAETSVEMAVVTIPETPPEVTPKAFATELFNTWGVGKAEENNGVLLLLSMGDRRIEIELGRGMETVLPGDRLSSLIQDTLRPLLQAGAVDQAVWAGVGAIAAILTGIDPDAPAVFAWTRPFYATLFVLGIALLGGSLLGIRQTYQKPVSLPPTGRQPFRSYEKPLQDIDFDRLVKTSPHRPKRPVALLLLLACSVPLIATALAFWSATLWFTPFDTRTNLLLLLTVMVAIALALLLPLYLDPWLHTAPGNPPFNLLRSLGLVSQPDMTWGDRLMQGAIALGMLSYMGSLIGSGIFVLWLVYGLLWSWATTVTPALEVSVAAPLFVTLGSGAIAAYYFRENHWLSRPATGYCCETCQGEIVDLASQSPELRPLLPHRANTTYRAWHCPTCHPTLSEDGIFLFTEEKTPSTPSKSTSQYQSRPTTQRSSSAYDPDDTGSIPSSGGSDFGGGSSDGGGVGDHW